MPTVLQPTTYSHVLFPLDTKLDPCRVTQNSYCGLDVRVMRISYDVGGVIRTELSKRSVEHIVSARPNIASLIWRHHCVLVHGLSGQAPGSTESPFEVEYPKTLKAGGVAECYSYTAARNLCRHHTSSWVFEMTFNSPSLSMLLDVLQRHFFSCLDTYFCLHLCRRHNVQRLEAFLSMT
jgi:hypothetical protein